MLNSRRIHRWMLAVLAVCFAGVTATAQAPKSGSKKGPAPGGNVYQKVIKSVVWVFDPIGDGTARIGTGSFIDIKDRIVITNYHVVSKDDEVMCLFPIFDSSGRPVTERQPYQMLIRSGRAPKGKVLVKIPQKDLAIIQLDQQHIPKDTPALRLAKNSAGQGDNIHCIGNAGVSGGLWNYVKGEVRNIAPRQFKTGNGKDDQDSFRVQCRMMEHSALVNKGDSGGPVVNDAGELVAVTQGHPRDEEGARGVSLAVDLSEVKDFLKANKYARLTTYSPAIAAAPPKEPNATTTSADAGPTDPKVEAEKREKTARAKLDFAKEFMQDGKKDKAKERLEGVIKDFPNTAAAAEAQELLKKLGS